MHHYSAKLQTTSHKTNDYRLLFGSVPYLGVWMEKSEPLERARLANFQDLGFRTAEKLEKENNLGYLSQLGHYMYLYWTLFVSIILLATDKSKYFAQPRPIIVSNLPPVILIQSISQFLICSNSL